MKVKRLVCVFLAALLLCGCSGNTADQMPADPAAPEAQLLLLEQMIDVWRRKEESAECYHYAVTDLDWDGHLEILAACTQGSGIFTYGALLEVGEDYRTVLECTMPNTAYADIPELICDFLPAAYDPEKKQYIYLATDERKGSATEYYQSIVAVRKVGHALTCEPLAHSYTQYVDAGIEEHEFAQVVAAGFLPIHISEYAAIIPDYQAQRQGFTANFEWFTFEEPFTGETLKNSWRIFRSALDAPF